VLYVLSSLAQTRRLKRLLKKETRGAVRELRKDASFLAGVRACPRAACLGVCVFGVCMCVCVCVHGVVCMHVLCLREGVSFDTWLRPLTLRWRRPRVVRLRARRAGAAEGA
jgi:hypothetical protein